MILFAIKDADFERGGVAYSRHLHKALLGRFSNDLHPPSLIKITPREMSSIIADVCGIVRSILSLRPHLTIIDVSAGVRNIIPFIVARMFGATLAVFQGIREDYRYRWGTGFARWCENTILRGSSIILVNSECLKRAAISRGVHEERILVVHPGVIHPVSGCRAKQLQRESEFRLLSVGVVEPRKGYEHLLRAFLDSSIQRARLDIVGRFDASDPYYQKLRSTVDAHPRGCLVKFHDHLPRKALDPLYLDAHLFILPSVSEGFGIVLVEAMSYGLPIVATRAGGIPEVVRDQIHTILCEPGNAASLRAAMERLLADSDLYRNMSENNIKRSKDFYDWNGFEDQIRGTLAPRIEALLRR